MVTRPSKKMLQRRGMMLILAAPPGGGKTSISRALLESDSEMELSVSATTRDQRPGEEEGRDYYFVSEDKFKDMIAQGEMLEYALVYNKSLYGTPKAPVEEALSQGKDVVFDIDWQGHLKLKATNEADVVSIFILPPSYADLEKRLAGRGRDEEDDIERRLKKAHDETMHYKEFQYILINEDFDEAVEKVRAIVEAERLKRQRLTNLDEYVESLEGDR